MTFQRFVVLIVLTFTFISFTEASNSSAPPWGLNDVSILLPILERDAPNSLFSTTTSGKFGALLPLSVQKRIGSLHSFEDPADSFARLRVVAIRIDPCFPDGPELRSCIPQVRFVWQPIRTIRNQMNIASDAAVHTFYSLPPEAFHTLVQELNQLRALQSRRIRPTADSIQGPLVVHPIIASESLKGPYFQALATIILSHTGEVRLTRATFTKLQGGQSQWVFGGFDFLRGALQRMQIPRVNSATEVFFNVAVGTQTDFTDSAITPPPPSTGENVNFISSDSMAVRRSGNPDRITNEALSAARLENPRLHATPQLDCVTCHIAQSSRIWATREFPQLDLQRKIASVSYRSQNFSLENTSRGAAFTANVRAFGYFDQLPAISQRVIHESAEVADALNADLNPATLRARMRSVLRFRHR